MVATVGVGDGLLLSARSTRRGGIFTCNGKTVTIEGTAGNDNIAGTNGDDVIHSLGGSDNQHRQR
ncbi:MAG: hypothetical protein ACREXY_00750 [Gammaproteobacteria bacterium]